MGVFSFIQSIGLLQSLCLIIGLMLVILEMFNPGFGAPGITGLILLVLGIILTARSLFEAIMLIIIILALLGIAFIFVYRSVSKGRLSKNLILSEALNTEAGFASVDNMEHYLGKEGTAVTPLRPAGIAVIDGVKLDVVTEGEYLPPDTRIVVIKVSGRRIVVKELK